MPDVRFNAEFWAGRYDWALKGEEWSTVWGSSFAQWFGAILPRVHSFRSGRENIRNRSWLWSLDQILGDAM